MNKKRCKKFAIIIGLLIGALADGYLRFISGDEGNLLVHSAVFIVSALIVTVTVYGIFNLWNMIFLKEKE